jgi:hypothetical protein
MRMALRLATVLCAAALAAPARADAIDGDWCYSDGRHMSINGPTIITPAGRRTEGNYARHNFSYTVPPAEPGAGQFIAMVLLNEETVQLRAGTDPAAAAQATPQTWRRCQRPVS